MSSNAATFQLCRSSSVEEVSSISSVSVSQRSRPCGRSCASRATGPQMSSRSAGISRPCVPSSTPSDETATSSPHVVRRQFEVRRPTKRNWRSFDSIVVAKKTCTCSIIYCEFPAIRRVDFKYTDCVLLGKTSSLQFCPNDGRGPLL